MKLSMCKKGAKFVICGLSKNADLKNLYRLLELGFVEGEEICVLGFSALKTVLLVQIKNYVLSLRVSLAELVLVK